MAGCYSYTHNTHRAEYSTRKMGKLLTSLMHIITTTMSRADMGSVEPYHSTTEANIRPTRLIKSQTYTKRGLRGMLSLVMIMCIFLKQTLFDIAA